MLGGQGADFVRGVAFWSIRSSGLLRPSLCVAGVALADIKVRNPLRVPRQTTLQRPKVARTCGVLSSSKSAPTLVCFVHFDFEMCFAHNGVHFFDI